MNSVAKIVSERILKLLEKDLAPWKKPYFVQGGVPTNFTTKIPYRGINRLLLIPEAGKSNYYLTFKQICARNAAIKPGAEKDWHLVVFWKCFNAKDSSERESVDSEEGLVEPDVPVKQHFMMRYYRVWNLSDTNIKIPEKEFSFSDADAADIADSVFHEMPQRPVLIENEEIPCYIPSRDTIVIPPRRCFESGAAYASTLFHEAAHATGHQTRLNRDLCGNFSEKRYAKEELIAELSAAFLMQEYNLLTSKEETNSASYLASWASKHDINWRDALRHDQNLFISAASAAEKACNWISGKTESRKSEHVA